MNTLGYELCVNDEHDDGDVGDDDDGGGGGGDANSAGGAGGGIGDKAAVRRRPRLLMRLLPETRNAYSSRKYAIDANDIDVDDDVDDDDSIGDDDDDNESGDVNGDLIDEFDMDDARIQRSNAYVWSVQLID
jgi:hypothetical protein